MTELEKLDAGLEYDFWDEGVNARKLNAIEICAKLNVLPVTEEAARERAIRELFGAAGRNPTVLPTFCCDNGKNIRVGGGNFLANYNVTILDIAPVTIGDYVMIGPNTLITTVNHPLSPAGRRRHLGQARPVVIGRDVWDRRELRHFAGRDHRQQRGDRGRRGGDPGCAGQLRRGRRSGPEDQGHFRRYGGNGNMILATCRSWDLA